MRQVNSTVIAAVMLMLTRDRASAAQVIGPEANIGNGTTTIPTGTYNSITGGENNSIAVTSSGSDDLIAGGKGNSISTGLYNSIGGGSTNLNSALSNSMIGGGYNNGITTGNYEVIGGGNGNTMTGTSQGADVIAGGNTN